MRDMNMRTLAREEWPVSLHEIPGPPKQLWIRGMMPKEKTKLLAVVGSRALSNYGKEACEILIAGLAGYPISIISGLALGADACAHKAALATGLHTIAIPGSGLDDSVIGPKTNLGLAENILKAGGALISEHESLHKAAPYDFPSRNRIMAGMADAVLVIEAGAKSGTLITARLAVDYNRELLVIPHRIGDPHGFGAHLFGRLGATIVTESSHILEALRITPREEKTSPDIQNNLTGAELLVWHILEKPKTRDEILRHSSDNTAEILTAIVTLELRGIIHESFGTWQRK